jgi:hypothetical protein
MMKESYNDADEVIKHALVKGVDLSAHREQIAQELFDDGLLNGNWDCSIELEDLKIRVINEDEYDQHMDHVKDKPTWKSMTARIMLGYLWIKKA